MKYVALLAFNKIVLTHPHLVAQQEDVIMECIDSPDISIRLRALDLVVGMVNPDNLMSIVGRLMRQLKNARAATAEELNPTVHPIEPTADFGDEDVSAAPTKSKKKDSEAPLLPDDYKVDVIKRILEMCSSNNYNNLIDFDWYLDVLIQLVRSSPVPFSAGSHSESSNDSDVSGRIGDELRSIAVKVKAVRLQATRAAEEVLVSTYNEVASHLTASSAVLRPVVWVVGEYANHLGSAEGTLTALLQLSKVSAPSESLIIYLQALPKIFAVISSDDHAPWTYVRKTMVALLMTRIIHVVEPLAIHPDIEVQERAVELLELLKLAAEASAGQEVSTDVDQQSAPLLLTQAIPSLFMGMELNSVAIGAQKNVPVPLGLDLDQPININLSNILKAVESYHEDDHIRDEFEDYYYRAPAITNAPTEPAINRLEHKDEAAQSYQQSGEDSYLDPDIVARRRAERMERNKDDPFYIAPPEQKSGRSTPLHNILHSNNGQDLDLDAIPIMQLELGTAPPVTKQSARKVVAPLNRQRIQIAPDETLAISGSSTPRNDSETSLEGSQRLKAKVKGSLLHVDSSQIGTFSLEGSEDNGIDFEQQQKEDAEMAKAMKEVEKLRLEMQRASERVHVAQGVEGTVVKKKKKKAKPAEEVVDGSAPIAVVKKKKKKVVALEAQDGVDVDTVEVVKSKKKKKKVTKIDEGLNQVAEGDTG